MEPRRLPYRKSTATKPFSATTVSRVHESNMSHGVESTLLALAALAAVFGLTRRHVGSTVLGHHTRPSARSTEGLPDQSSQLRSMTPASPRRKRPSVLFSFIGWTAVSAAVFLMGGCATTSQSARVHPVFDYVPEQVEISNDPGVTFAVVGSSFSSPLSYSARGLATPIPLFERFSSSMAADFGEILSARGYTWRGPFRTFDEMTFPDKEGSNLILTAEVTFDYDIENMRLTRNIGASFFGGDVYTASGPITVVGRINLVISESVTNERMWTKSV